VDPSASQEARSKDERRRQYWLLAAVLFIGGGLGAAPSDALHQPGQPPTIYLLPLLAIGSGLICLALAGRAPIGWLHGVTVVATLEIALTVWLADPVFAIYYTFIALYAAYVFDGRRAIGCHVLFASAAVLFPLAYSPGTARETLTQALVLIPTLVLAAGTVTALRERLEASEQRYRHLAYRDPLTGLGNYRMLTERLPRELDHHRRQHHPLALIVIDLDDFKRVNDENGHQFGDGVLKQVARTLSAAVRARDLVVRQGGDEFSIVAPESNRDSARMLARRICEALSAITVGDRPIGGCAGCAVFPADAESVDGLLSHADDELRASKGARRWAVRSEDPLGSAQPRSARMG
jgi:diguanylate cyclase (GGDEF)-like protein